MNKNRSGAEKQTVSRRGLFALLGAAPVAMAQSAALPSPKINELEQSTNFFPGGGDNWQAIVPAGPVNGTNTVFTIAVPAKKIRVFLNGQRLQQASEINSPALGPAFVWISGGAIAQTITFTVAPQLVNGVPDAIVVDWA